MVRQSLFRVGGAGGGGFLRALLALGATAAFVYSTYALFAMTDAQVRGDMGAVMLDAP